MLLVFVVWLVVVVLWALRNRSDDIEPGMNGFLIAATSIVGLLMLFLAGQLIVSGATGMAAAAGLPTFIIGATVVAIGTSVPELATVLISSLRGHHDVGLQTILGSNIFNSLFIVPTAALISPISVGWSTAAPTLAVGFAVTILIVPLFRLHLGRWRGGLLIATYVAYVAMTMSSVH